MCETSAQGHAPQPDGLVVECGDCMPRIEHRSKHGSICILPGWIRFAMRDSGLERAGRRPVNDRLLDIGHTDRNDFHPQVAEYLLCFDEDTLNRRIDIHRIPLLVDAEAHAAYG